MTQVRTERRVGVTQRITPGAARNLFVLANSETWGDLLDVLETCVIEIEGNLINTDAADEASVLANHKLSQAAWVMFEKMQTRIIDAGTSYMSGVASQPVAPRLTEEEQEREYTLNPTNVPDLPDGFVPGTDGI